MIVRATNRVPSSSHDNPLGTFLKDRRARLDPVAFGFGSERRRTPGLRREEVAQRAHVSATWYTWLEQGRGGAPSAEVLDRLSRALMLTPAEREHLFLLAQSRPPEVSYNKAACVSPQLQRVLDSMKFTPALIKTAAWDILAWNHAATVVLADYEKLRPEQRNILRIIFCNPHVRARMPDWEQHARLSVATFRMETARAGANEMVRGLVDELSAASPEFAAIWLDNDVRTQGEGTKRINHPVAGLLSFEYSTFSVDDQPGLGMMIYAPATAADMERVRELIEARKC